MSGVLSHLDVAHDVVSQQRGDAPVRGDQKDLLERHRRVLKEQVYLLKEKSSNGVGVFLKHKLYKALDDQMTQLKSVRLRRAFERLHKQLEERELTLVSTISDLEESFKDQIKRDVKAVEDLINYDLSLVRQGEIMLSQGNEAILDSAQVAELLQKIEESNSDANEHGDRRREIDDYVNGAYIQALANYDAVHVDSVERSILRIDIAPSEKGQVGVLRSGNIDLSKLEFAAVSRLAWRSVKTQWLALFTAAAKINTKDQLRALVEDLCHSLAGHATHDMKEDEDFEAYTSTFHVTEHVSELFTRYTDNEDDGGDRALQLLKDQASDAILGVFEHMSDNNDQVYREIKGRLDHDKVGKVGREEIAGVWGGYVEKRIENALRETSMKK